ncbi:cytochrome c oxidase subunit II [Psychromarinibacter sp. C21-152]|uniref:cytochrome-c oxidase n=1 Tax=Psychromarinibacter sediminicola TaxID=3033385 RepID=A0AAE3TBJ9_9RHOB|nr:cytochrome c oxidase subunit II [Psychromarinibacter sediminicola]MDF0602755.1 cytochrome c oxidase subunit II [Psychromarinibacter sediminicola]
MNEGIRIFPDSASTFAPQVDLLFFTLVAFAGALGLFLTGLVIVYAARYRRNAPAARHRARGRSLPFEIAWTSATTIVAAIIFAWGAALFLRDERIPSDALVVNGIAKQWMWKFRHPGGQREINALHVPRGEPVVVRLGSQDVIHSMFVPAFRVKQDVVPGRSTELWFEATKTGKFRLFCAEYCGTEHSKMTGWITVMEPEDYADWLDRQAQAPSMAEEGEALFRALGCSGCHGASSEIRAPELAGIFSRPVATETGTVTADATYIRDSILQPDKHVAAGYRAVMPSFDGLVSEAELQALVAYIRSLSLDEEVPQ